MKGFTAQLCIALIAGAGLLATTLPAEARDSRHWQNDHHTYGPGWSHQRQGPPPHVVQKRHGKQKVEVHHHYYQPRHYGRHPGHTRYAPPRYAPPRHVHQRHSTVTRRHVSSSPTVVINLPPIVIR